MLFCLLCLRIGEEKSDELGEPWFCAKDVCDALRYKAARNALAQHVDEDDKPVPWFRGVVPTTNPQAFFINEPVSTPSSSHVEWRRTWDTEVDDALKQGSSFWREQEVHDVNI